MISAESHVQPERGWWDEMLGAQGCALGDGFPEVCARAALPGDPEVPAPTHSCNLLPPPWLRRDPENLRALSPLTPREKWSEP